MAVGCEICESDLASAKTLRVKEMLRVKGLMNGTREVFDYVVCPSCGCVQLVAVPDNLVDYYSHYFGRRAINTRGLKYRMQK